MTLAYMNVISFCSGRRLKVPSGFQVTIEFRWFGLQSNVESFIGGYEEKLFAQFHRKIWCWADEWFGMSLEDIRSLEDKTKEDLEEQRIKGELRGTMPTS